MVSISKGKKVCLWEAYKKGFKLWRSHRGFWIILIFVLIAINIGENIIHNYVYNNLIIEKIIFLFMFVINNVILPIFIIAASWQSLKNKKIDLKKFEKKELNFDMILNMLTWAIIEIFAFVLLPTGVFYMLLDKSKPIEMYIEAIKAHPLALIVWVLAVIIVYIIMVTRFMFVEYNIVIKKEGITNAILNSWKHTKKHWGLLITYYLIVGSILLLSLILTFGIALILILPWYWLSKVYLYERISE